MAMHSFPSERDLQTFLEEHSEVLGDLIIIGRYVETDGHGELDLVAIDGSARLWVIELKNLSATRKIMEQTLGYTSWAESASVRNLENLYSRHLDGASLKQDFEERYGRSLPCRDEMTVLVAIVAFKIDDHAHCQLLTLARHDFPVRAYEYGLSYGAGGPVFLLQRVRFHGHEPLRPDEVR